MRELMVLMAGTLDRSTLLELLQEAIDQYRNDPTDAHWQHASAICSMILLKIPIEQESGDGDQIKGALKIMKEIKISEKILSDIKPTET